MIDNIARLTDSQSWGYIARSALYYVIVGQWTCPCCGSHRYQVMSRKSIVTALVRCQSCRLLYRAPRDPSIDNAAFYQEDYASGGLATTLPPRSELQRLLACNFEGTDKNFRHKIGLLRTLGIAKGAKILDFGCSWGYATWQLRHAGYDATGFEISEPRAKFGRQYLKIDIATREDELAGPFDVFFSSHVLEHFSNPRKALAIARRQLRDGGIFIAFTPNGSLTRLRLDRNAYNHSWGRLHPIYLDDGFYRHNLTGPCFFTSRDYGCWNEVGEIAAWDRSGDGSGDLTKPELLAIWLKTA